MSDYGDRSRRRGTRTREPEYVETEDVYARGAGSRDLVVRDRDRDRDDYDDYPSEYRRRSYREDYGPPERRSRSHGYGGRGSFYDEDYYSDYAPRSSRPRSSRYDDDYDDYDRPRERRKSKVEGVLEDLGLGGVAATFMNKARSRSRHRRGDDDRSRHYSRSRSRDNTKKWQQAAKAAVLTGVIEAVRSRKEPGGWTGAKGQRIATAALGAAGIDGFLDRDPSEHSKRHIVESVVGGLGINRVANGPRERSETRGRSQSRGISRSRSRSKSVIDRIRSRSRSVFGRDRSQSRDRGRSSSRGPGVKGLVGAGALATAGKLIFDRVRSKSRGRLGRSRSRSVGSDDSYVPSHRPRYTGNRDRGGPSDEDNRGRQAEQDTEDGGARGRSSSSSSVSTADLETQRRKTRTKELLTAGLATVATIHAAHGVYSSMVASDSRHKKVLEGKMSPEQARKQKSKNMLQDAAAVGIAALGIKSAFSEWKEMNESRHAKHEIEKRHRQHKKARERRQREMQQPVYGGGYPPTGGYPQQAIGGAPAYGDANPYQAYAPNLPPPPVGGPPR